MKSFSRGIYFILLLPAAIASILLFSAYSGNDTRYPGGSPPGYTGSPADGKDCTQCHGGSASQVSGWITSNIPDDGYVPGETYTITATVSGNGDKGFLISPQNLAGDKLGQLIVGSGTELAGTGYITQSNGSSANPKIWNFEWVAPPAVTGPVTFYGAFTVNKPVTKLDAVTYPERIFTSIDEQNPEIRVWPNPASTFIGLETDGLSIDAEIKLYNVSGQLIKSFRSQQDSKNTYMLDITDVRAGLYFLHAEMGDMKLVRKVVID